MDQSAEGSVKLCQDQSCERKGQLLALTEFPVNRNIKSGRHSYCKACSLRRCLEYRERMKPAWDAKKEARAAERRQKEQMKRDSERAGRISAIDRVKNAIREGHNTREGIEAQTGFDEDTVADLVAQLWDRDQLRIQGPRFYLRAA